MTNCQVVDTTLHCEPLADKHPVGADSELYLSLEVSVPGGLRQGVEVETEGSADVDLSALGFTSGGELQISVSGWLYLWDQVGPAQSAGQREYTFKQVYDLNCTGAACISSEQSSQGFPMVAPFEIWDVAFASNEVDRAELYVKIWDKNTYSFVRFTSDVTTPALFQIPVFEGAHLPSVGLSLDPVYAIESPGYFMIKRSGEIRPATNEDLPLSGSVGQ